MMGVPPPPRKDESDQQQQVYADHLFHPGHLDGRCARRNCDKRQDQHPTVRPLSDAEARDGVCPVNHQQLTIRRTVVGLIGGPEPALEGWTQCPQCFVTLEPKLATGVYEKREYGWGRGEATPRFLKRVEAFVGWVQFQAWRREVSND